MSERIKEAAIRQDGKVWTGRRHHEIIHLIVQETGRRPVTGQQGFVTEEGRFVDREEAARIAWLAGQVTKLRGRQLYSEDLY